MIRCGLLTALALALTTPAFADIPLITPPAVLTGIPRQLSDAQRDSYRQIFQSLRSGDYKTASAGLPSMWYIWAINMMLAP